MSTLAKNNGTVSHIQMLLNKVLKKGAVNSEVLVSLCLPSDIVICAYYVFVIITYFECAINK